MTQSTSDTTESPSESPTHLVSFSTQQPTGNPSYLTSSPSQLPTEFPTNSFSFVDTVFPTPEPTVGAGFPTLQPIALHPTLEPVQNITSSDGNTTNTFQINEPSGHPTSNFWTSGSGRQNNYPVTHSSDIALSIIVISVLMSWMAMAVFYIRKRMYAKQIGPDDKIGLLTPEVSKRKRTKKFEDYWDEESEESRRKQVNDTISEGINIDISSSSIDTFNSSKDPRFS